MRRRPSGTYVEVATAGERFRAFVLLPVPPLPPFVKEDGSVVVNRGVRRW